MTEIANLDFYISEKIERILEVALGEREGTHRERYLANKFRDLAKYTLSQELSPDSLIRDVEEEILKRRR